MEHKLSLLASSVFSSSYSTPLPIFISNKPKLSVSVKFLNKSQIWGRSLSLSFVPSQSQSQSQSQGDVKFDTPFQIRPMRVRAAVKRRKELPFDNVIQRDKKLKFVLKVRKILMRQPYRFMSVKELGRYKRELGLDRKRRLVALLKKFPAVFQIVEEGVHSLRFKMTPDAERLYFEELRVRNEMEDLLVVKLRKLLMMSMEKRILLEKIAHLMTDLGLPLDFRDTICRRYPQYFKVVTTERGPALELTHWDPELAVSAAELSAEENRARELEELNLIIDRPPKFNRVKLPKGLNLSKGETRKLMQFRDLPLISPYSDFSMLRLGSREKEKHSCGVVHEILNLTLEKRTLVDHLTHFREEFRFPERLRGMLIRHPDMFYVSLKGDTDSVFLREGYRDSQLIEKDRLLLINEKLRSLVDVPRFPKGAARRRVGDGMEGNDSIEDASGEVEEEWSDVDSFMTDDGFDNNDDDDDDIWSDDEEEDDDNNWSDEDDDDDTPPDYDDDDAGTLEIGQRKTIKQVEGSRKNKEKVLAPTLPDDYLREPW